MKELIKRKALEIGFDAIGFTAPSLNSIVTENFDNFISNGFCLLYTSPSPRD